MARTNLFPRPAAPKAFRAGTSTIKPQVKVLSDPVNIVSQFYNNKQKEFLTDSVIVFHGQSYPFQFWKEKLLSSDPEVNFPQLEFIVPDANIFFEILDYFYGQPLHITFDNIGSVLALCSALQLSSLKDPIQKVMSEGFSKSRRLQLKSEEVLQIIKSGVQRDVLLSYKDKSLTISSLVLISCSEYFKNLFCTLNQHNQELKEVKQQVVALKTELNEVKQQEVVLSKEVKEVKQKEVDLSKEVIFLNHELRSLRESVIPLIQIHEENERKRIELSKNLFNRNNCGSKLSLSNTNTVVKKNGFNGDAKSFVEVILLEDCSVKFTRLDGLGNNYSDFIGWKEGGSLQNGSNPGPCIRTKGTCSIGFSSPSESSFPTITKGESITVSFCNGKAHFKPSTCTTTFSTDIPSNFVFGMTVWCQNHEWKVERV
ncbi:hypothetical protein GEMRC1_000094 [Eukaryota sp. GEM-RC1]